MKTPIYTLGYARWSIADVERRIEALGALLVDIRQSPYTSKPGFSKPDLESRLGHRYNHLAAFGNTRYQTDGVELAAPDAGIAALRSIEHPPVLMCGCRSPDQCHRSTVAKLLQTEFGGSIVHLQSPEARAQPGLFGT